MTGKIGRRDVLRMGRSLGVGVAAGLTLPLTVRPARSSENFPVNIITTSGNATLAAQELMKQQGYLKEFGVDATFTNVADGTKIMGALVSGSSDICVGSGFSQVFPAIAKGAKLKIVAGANLLADYAVYSKKPDVKTMKDLIGRTVGTGSLGALQHQVMVALLNKKGLDYKKVTFVNIGSGGDVFRAVVAGTVDAGPSEIDVYDQQEKYGFHALSDGNTWTELPEYTYQATYTSDDAIANKPEAIARVLAAYSKFYRFIQSPDSKEAFINSFLAQFKSQNPNDVRRQGETQWNFYQKYKPYSVDLVLSEERMQYMQDLNKELGIQDQILPFDKVADMSLARKAMKLVG